MLDVLQFHYLNIDHIPSNYFIFLAITFFFFLLEAMICYDIFTYPQPYSLRKIVLEYCGSHVYTCYNVPVKGMSKLQI